MVLKTMIFNFTTYANKYFCTAIQMCICMKHTQKCMVISYFSFEILSAICLGFKTAKSNQVLSKQLDTLLCLMFLVPICLLRMMPFRQQKMIGSIAHSFVWLKFIYSEKATNFCEISTENLSYVVMVKSTVEIL